MCWIRLIGGEEFVSACRVMSDGVFVQEPTAVTYMQGNIVLAPYGFMARGRGFFFAAEHVLHISEASDSMLRLYEASLDNTRDYSEAYFEQLVVRSIATVRANTETERREPTPAELAEVESSMDELLSTPAEFEGVEVEKPKPRSRSQVIDDLAKLADEKGKGRKISGKE